MCAMRDIDFITETDYLEMERNSDTKHEYFQGEIFDMARASPNHDRITRNVIVSLHGQLGNSPCEVFTGDMRLKVDKVGLITYPDVKIVCGKPNLTQDKPPSLLDATVIIEVLSPSTEKYDRTKKFEYYRQLDSFQEYILISQDSINVQKFHKRNNEWIFTDASDLEATIQLESVDCTLNLADIYQKVEFDDKAE